MGMGPTPHLDYMGTRQIDHTQNSITNSISGIQHMWKAYRQSVVHMEAGCINQHAFTDVRGTHKVRAEAGVERGARVVSFPDRIFRACQKDGSSQLPIPFSFKCAGMLAHCSFLI